MFASSIFISYTRGIWLALLISVGLIFILSFVNSKRPILNDFDDAALLAVALGIIIAAVFSPTVRDRVEGLIDVDVSVSERLNQVEPLTAKWKERPILGNGYGAYVQGYVRDERTPYSYENVPAMLLMKLGVSGVLWFSGFFLVVVGSALRRIKDTPVEVTHLLAGLAALLITSMTNPYLISFVGMSVLGCLLIQWASLFNLSRKDEASRWRV
jgi:O-antigen ligase